MSRYKVYAAYKDSGLGWLGTIPQHWEYVRLKYAANLVGNKVESGSNLKYVGMENVESGNGKYVEKEEVTPEGQATSFSKGDVLFGKLRPYLAKSWLAEFSGICSSEFLVLESRKVSARFLNYYTLTDEFIKQVDSSTYGSKMPRASWDFIGLLDVPVPLNESEKIANFLDHETAKIDTLIAKQQELIKLLKEKRQAVISHAVTKGTNPNAPMRDSGVEWLGEVPAHWDVVNVRNLIRAEALEIQDGNHGELHPVAAEYVDDGIPFLMASNVQNGNVSLRDSKYISLERAESLRIGFAKPNDVLLTHKGTVGEVALIPEVIDTPYWMLTPQVTYYRWKNAKYLNRFFYMFFRSTHFQDQLTVIGGKQSTRAYVGVIAQGDLILVVPPIIEQLEIYAELEKSVTSYEYLIAKSEIAINYSNERRTALISAAVTGKIDVRDWQPAIDSTKALAL